MRMKEFKIVFSLKPAVRLAPKLQNILLSFDESKGLEKVMISKIEETVAETKIQSGLHLEVFLHSESLKDAIAKAKDFVDGIVSFITLTTGVGLNVPSEDIAYEISPDVEKRDFVQIFHDPFRVTVSRRRLDHQLFTQMIDHSMKLDPETQRCIGRAIRWYRMGTMASDIFDRFNCFWIGLEALNPILQGRFSVRDDVVKCHKCGYEWITMPIVSGIRMFFQKKTPDGAKLYKRAHGLRNSIMHSKHELRPLVTEALQVAPKTAEVLFRAICYILELERWDEIVYRSILEKFPIRIELEATLVGGNQKL